jgi:TetR/AcrR family transcriptional repressor of lmrAB and yxaGH operons
MASDTRVRILDAAARQFRTKGYGATGVKAILVASNAPYGSLYHHYPGGKQELGEAVIRAGGDFYRSLVVLSFDNTVPLDECVRQFFAGAARLLESTDFEDACPIATLALEVANTDERMRRASSEAFESWIDALSARVRHDGADPADARRFAVQAFCALEGAFLHARTTRSVEALQHAAAGLVDALRTLGLQS